MLMMTVLLLGPSATLAQTNSAISSKIYFGVTNSYPCTRLLDATREIGCNGRDGGDSGPIHLLDSDEAYRNVPEGAIVLVEPDYFNYSIVNGIISKKSIHGMIVLTDTPQSYAYSQDLVSPNDQYSYYAKPQFNWNPHGDAMSYAAFPMPIFALDHNESVTARAHALSNRLGKDPTWGAQLDSFMHSSTNAYICLRRRVCQPMGSKSVWASFTPKLGQKDILMVVIPMDATAFFHGLAIGAESTAYGQTVMISVMSALNTVNKETWKLDVVFVAFNGERWGYLGSSRFVEEVINFKCEKYSSDNNSCVTPYNQDLAFLSIDFARVKYIVELNQIGNPTTLDKDGRPTFALNSLSSNTNADQKALFEYFNNTANELPNLNIAFAPVDPTTVPELPPSSVMSFLKKNSSIASIVVTDHFGAYTNPHFSSHNDLYTNTNETILADTVTYSATLIDRIAGGNNSIVVNATLAKNFYYCLTQNFSCGYFPFFTHESSDGVPPNYANVYGYSPMSSYVSAQALFIFQQMAYMVAYNTTGQVCDITHSCSAGQACVAGACLWANAHFHDALSLAFEWTGAEWIIKNQSYSTWVESNWDYYNVKYFQMASKTSEVLFLVFGILEVFIVAGIIYVSQRYLSKRYKLL